MSSGHSAEGVGSGWHISTHRESAAAFHARGLPEVVRREVWIADVTGPALVLGSTQDEATVDRDACDEAGIDLVRRRSGGGAVLVTPGDLVWLDVIIPTGDPRWDPDVGRAFLWLGDAWAAALADLGVAATVHRGGLVQTEWSRTVCFAGTGPGEVTLATGGKAVGISQRRTRGGCRFQCAALLAWQPDRLVPLLAVDPADRLRLGNDLSSAGAAIPVEPEALVDRLLTRLA